jgi:hypothetical protein
MLEGIKNWQYVKKRLWELESYTPSIILKVIGKKDVQYILLFKQLLWGVRRESLQKSEG